MKCAFQQCYLERLSVLLEKKDIRDWDQSLNFWYSLHCRGGRGYVEFGLLDREKMPFKVFFLSCFVSAILFIVAELVVQGRIQDFRKGKGVHMYKCVWGGGSLC